ncbi:5-carboxymethyl-2-hydroxymuconate semialdehyde dehydrogenase [Brucella ovis IntaBari-2006-46-332]|uniref:5-carboxymethyl-2-hydroxymuconate semialdehyde dehydrogenase n=1 Tax=Brucella ovis (strain ATCC 25840 / 63/290 / NCTC 10512) TaxID=444178 RepID=A0A0H3AVM8_BRUO2|nr:5-carboxymethyl-2-hydroxymuconate semialdehyde dehydrogenase [Brucella ovis]ABQ62616.1 5-carboxymethyl-2-hydroxymuconate semialdehyde dehydrogenase [Brucella ovis ATCC 25840]ENR02037.1 5-carboxymethyl-2-hydroxymuconate semialdehyde dehydrogenase [Brucella ovis 80/125]ENR05235.1 5-carboxymethyl-2-hydroxymuconate semialdehyde dehydrogenase [Brucella ovis F8/05B]ENS93842.1 5-carboxymethyl-2-hydroxymuconate semialdehyde dehydrogenase [Brucella ovis 63/96]ENS95438.1 5-carboxymethyl-2-hydroxymuco
MSKLDDNVAKAKTYLARFEKGVLNRIGGEDVAAADGATFETISPVDLKPLATVALGKAADIDRAARAAKAAFPEWAAMSGDARKKLLHKIADAIVARAEEIAFVECMDTGQSLKFMAKAALRGAENFRFFADRAPEARDGKTLRGPGQVNMTTRVPIGPVGVITPWNTPFMLSTWKIAPALAAGCTVVHKPAEFSPLTARLLVEIAEEAGLPKGVWNLVNGFGEDAGKALTEHPDIKAIGFVGESRTGSLIMKQGADTLKRVHFELGGKNPVVVFADADLERAVDAAVFMIYSLNGERCTSSSRLLVEASIYEKFTALVAEKAKRIKVGHPLDPETVVGPLIHPVHEKKVLEYIEIGRSEGATVAAGGAKFAGPGGGCYVSPTLFTAAHNGMRIAQEEIFGPVLTAIPFKAEALALANDVKYGLTGYLWTNDVTRAFRFTDALEAGMIWVNSENMRHLPTPFGGVKNSGIGRDGGDWSFDFYMETKNIAFANAAHAIAKLGG